MKTTLTGIATLIAVMLAAASVAQAASKGSPEREIVVPPNSTFLQFCVYSSATYLFSNIKSPKHPGWKFAYQKTSEDAALENLGLWQISPQGQTILKTNETSTVIPENKKKVCRRVVLH